MPSIFLTITCRKQRAMSYNLTMLSLIWLSHKTVTYINSFVHQTALEGHRNLMGNPTGAYRYHARNVILSVHAAFAAARWGFHVVLGSRLLTWGGKAERGGWRCPATLVPITSQAVFTPSDLLSWAADHPSAFFKNQFTDSSYKS